MSPHFPVLVYRRLTLVVKRGDSRQTLTMFLGWENIILTINCLRHSTIKPFHAVSCGGLPANSGNISIHEPTYTSLFVLFALCCVPTINLVPEAATFNGLDTSCFENVSVHVRQCTTWRLYFSVSNTFIHNNWKFHNSFWHFIVSGDFFFF